MKIFLYLACLIFIVSCGKDQELRVLSLSEKANGMSYDDLSIAFGKWIFKSGLVGNPLNDETGAAHKNQPIEGVVILASNFGGSTVRSLNLTEDDYLFVTVAGSTSWFYDNDKCDTSFMRPQGISDLQYLDLITKEFVGDINSEIKTVSVKMDGVELVSDKKLFYHKTPIFETLIHKDWNIEECDYTGKTAKVLNEGYDVLMKLPKGKHTLLVAYDWPSAMLSGDITWSLTVE